LVLVSVNQIFAGSQRPQFVFRIHVEAVDQIHNERVVPVALQDPDEIIRVHKFPIVHEKYIIGAVRSPSGGVLLTFNQIGRHALETATRTEIGKTLVVILNGRVVYSAEIDVPMSTGHFLIPQGIEETDMTLLQAYIEQRKRL